MTKKRDKKGQYAPSVSKKETFDLLLSTARCQSYAYAAELEFESQMRLDEYGIQFVTGQKRLAP